MIEKTDWLIQPEFSPHVFWDRDITKIDFQRDATFVIRRVFEVGKLQDVVESTAYYGTSRVIDALTSAVSLRVNAVNLAAAIFQIPKTMFKCYTSKPSRTSF